MYKLCLNSRDGLLILDLEKIAFFQAQGNYTHLQYIKGEHHLLMLGLSKVEELIRKSLPREKPSPFIRLGRSLIINQTFISEINILKQRLTLTDRGTNSYNLTVPKPLLKEYKERINDFYLKSNTEDNKS